MRHLTSMILIACAIAFSSPVFSQDTKEKEKPKIATVDVTSKQVDIYDTIDGLFESTDTHELKTDFETWTDLQVKKVVNEGKPVVEGTILLQFDTESIDKAIKEAEFALKTAQFAYEDAKLAMKGINETFEMDRAAAERTWKNAQEDYDYYKNVLLPQRKDDLDYNEKSAGYFLEYSRDELDQLEQMYNEDELTEESEEIVLKRARRSVESAERSQKRTLQSLSRQREFEIPREIKTREDEFQKQKIEFDKSKVTLPIKKQRAEIALLKAEYDLKNKQEKLDELTADRKKMEMRAGAEGIVYYGQCVRGKWVGPTGTAARDIKVGAKLAAKKVVMTIVNPDRIKVRANLSEEQLYRLSPGALGTALAKATRSRLPVSIETVSNVPSSTGTYDCQLSIERMPDDSNIMPGMSCKISFKTFSDDDAVLAPKASVFSDDDGVTHYVYVVEDNEATKVVVKAGRAVGTDLVILGGLKAGQKIAKTRQ